MTDDGKRFAAIRQRPSAIVFSLVPARGRLALAALLALLPALAAARPARPAHPAFDLFAGAFVTLDANRVQCSINTIGELCVDPTNSPVYGSGFWPGGSPDQYIFNAGMQFAAIVSGAKSASFPWPGDTIGAFFFDPRGDQNHGAGVNGIFNSLVRQDLRSWPSAARANDPALFSPYLLGRPFISDQDTWLRYWDGNANLRNGRAHPVGMVVDQRTVAFNRPGLEDAIFFILRFINVSSRNPASYQQLASAGYDAAAIADVAALGAGFQDDMEARYHILIPDDGYTFDSLYIAYAQDADIGNASQNYSNGNLVFTSTMAWKSDFDEPSWQFPIEIFAPPFASRPGFVADAFLRTPTLTGATGTQPTVSIVSNLTGGGALPDPTGVSRLWRYLSGNLVPSDGSCSVQNQKARHFCYLTLSPVDTRIFMATGPSTLAPGQSAVVVLAQVHAAPLAVLTPAQLANVRGGFPVDGARLLAGTDTLRDVDRLAGWVSHTDVNGDGRIDANEVITTPRSLYWKIQAAQAALGAGFLQPSAPDAPGAFVVPGDGQVTVVWQKSPTEALGDPYFNVASNPASGLYDPDFRRFDVEGYRVWRGRTSQDMQVVAQFDYAGTTMADYTGQLSVFGRVYTCAPELGVTSGCPAFPTATPLAGDVVQYRLGDRLLLSGGAVGILHADTAVTGGASGRGPLTDIGVPFVFVDHAVANGTPYVYGVTAFDVNSVRSGRSSLESPMRVMNVMPRIRSGQETAGSVGVPVLLAGDGTVLTSFTLPTLDRNSGIFSGPMPPTDGINFSLVKELPQLLADGDVTVTLDSVVPGSWFVNPAQPAVYWFTGQGAGAPVRFSAAITGATSSYFTDISTSVPFAATLLGQRAAAFGGDSTFPLYGIIGLAVNGDYRYTSQYRAAINCDPNCGFAEGPRWWTGAGNETTNDPNGINCLTSPAGFSCTLTDLSRNAGALPGVGIMNIAAYGTVGTNEPLRSIEGITSSVFRAADFKWYWGGGGAVDSVVDVTHRVRVPFSRKIRASWGILNDSSFSNVVNKQNLPDSSVTRLTWGDVACVAPAPRYTTGLGVAQSCGGVANFAAPDSGAFLMDHARLGTIVFASSNFAGLLALTNTATTPATQKGFIIYLDGHWFLMQMGGLPASGTVWNMRTYAGNILGAVGNYTWAMATRPAAVPGLRLRIPVSGATANYAASNDSLFQHVHPVPDPYYLTNSLESGTAQVIRFVNLPSRAIVRIYSASGILVAMLVHNDPQGSGEEAWDVRSRTGRRVAAGVYFYHVETADHRVKIGRMLVVNGR